MKAMEGHLTEHNILSVCDKVWQWTKIILVHEVNGVLEPPPDPPVDVENPRPDSSQSRQILVTDVKVYKQGIGKNNKPYTLWHVIDEGGIPYQTFAGSRFEIGKTYGILFKTSGWGTTLVRDILEATPVTTGDDDVPFRSVS